MFCKAVELIVSKDNASWLCRFSPPIKQPVHAKPAWHLCPAAPQVMLTLLAAGALILLLLFKLFLRSRNRFSIAHQNPAQSLPQKPIWDWQAKAFESILTPSKGLKQPAQVTPQVSH